MDPPTVNISTVVKPGATFGGTINVIGVVVDVFDAGVTVSGDIIVACTSPIFTDIGISSVPIKLVPIIVTSVPPVILPLFGNIFVIVGGSTYVNFPVVGE
jgi:hypothetical protein